MVYSKWHARGCSSCVKRVGLAGIVSVGSEKITTDGSRQHSFFSDCKGKIGERHMQVLWQ